MTEAPPAGRRPPSLSGPVLDQALAQAAADLSQGRTEAARALLAQLLRAAPDSAAVAYLSGLAAAELANSIAAFERAVELDPGHADAGNALGLARQAAGDPEGAGTAFRDVLERRPDHARAAANLAALLLAGGRPEAVVTLLRPADGAAPCDAAARGLLAQALLELGEEDAAAALLRKGAPETVEIAVARAQLLLRRGQLAEAVGVLTGAADAAPRHAPVRGLLAHALERLNRLDEAEAAAAAALDLSPADCGATINLARVERRTGRAGQARNRLRALLASPGNVSEAQRGTALVELGFACDRLGEVDAAFDAFAAGQALLAIAPEARRHDPERIYALLDALRDESPPVTSGEEPGPDDPVFLVGFPRSGTTLTEQILAAHPRLLTTDEEPFLPDLTHEWPALAGGAYPHGLASLSDDAAAQLRDRYRAALARRFGAGGRRVVDKLPLNILHLGLIRRLFPAAPVIVALRDPRDVVLSCFMQQFAPNAPMVQFFDLARSARFYAAVMDLWLGWREDLDPPAMESRYEDVVQDVERAARRLIAHVGEDWTDAVLAYADAARDRAITTPSYRDVGEPIHGRARGRWRRYEKQLAPVLGILDPYARALGYPPAPGKGNASEE
ncbi:MAG: sulfotransferase [Acetobacterales bacterium]